MALRDGIEALCETETHDEYGKPRNQKGYIELKTINGCGPYRYLRYWDGKTHRSVYLGKQKKLT